MNLTTLRNWWKARRNRRILLNHLPKRSVCAEIGVWRGDFSRRILAETKPRELHLIDPWLFQGEYPDRWYGGSIAKSQADMDRIYLDVKQRLGSKAVIHRGTSEEALGKFADDTFDWIYIDGDHGYDAVLLDLELCKRKIKDGGYIAGDDLIWGKDQDYPVQRAVETFIGKYGLKVNAFGSQFLIRV